MRKISDEQKQYILDLTAENPILDGFVLEKDIFVLSAISAVLSAKNEYFTPVFCGGTCLSKAYAIIERMSEDVDFKIIPTKLFNDLTSKTAKRKQLGLFGSQIQGNLVAAGLSPEDITKKARDENRYTEFNITIPSAFPTQKSLRPHILLELNYNDELAKQFVGKDVGCLINTLYPNLTKNIFPAPIQVQCISIEEALAEKLVSFPRRLAKAMRKNTESYSEDHLFSEENGWDQALVRHIYDVSVIFAKNKNISPQEISDLVKKVIKKDQNDFKNQHPEFLNDSLGEIDFAMKKAQKSKILKNQYDDFVAAMVYAAPETIPSFEKALSFFGQTLYNAVGLDAAMFEEIVQDKKIKIK